MKRQATLHAALALALCGVACDEPRDNAPRQAEDAASAPTMDALSHDTARPPAVDVDARVPTSLELGTGFSVFVPLEPAQRVEIIAGPQGGFHLWASLRTHGLSSMTMWRIECAFTRDGQVLAQANYEDRIVTPSAGEAEGLDYLGIAVVFADTEPMAHDGLPGTLSCHLVAPDDPAFAAPDVLNRLTDSTEVVPQCCKR